MFLKDHGLFEPTNSTCNSYSFPVKIDLERKDEYIFLGKIMAKALFENIPINCQLSRVIYKNIVDEDITFEDLNFIDEDLYISMVFIRDNPIEGVFFETFEVEKNKIKFELKDNGKEIKVTDENKSEYIDLRLKFETFELIKEGLDLLTQGFYSVIPKPLIAFFLAEELELALCGLPYIDIQDWKDFTEYRGEYSMNFHVIE